MKHLKTYENSYKSNVNYNIGDYIILEESTDWARKPYKCCQILDKKYSDYYNVKTFDEDYEIFEFYLRDDDILRLATPKEIEDYHIKLAANKFNL